MKDGLIQALGGGFLQTSEGMTGGTKGLLGAPGPTCSVTRLCPLPSAQDCLSRDCCTAVVLGMGDHGASVCSEQQLHNLVCMWGEPRNQGGLPEGIDI